MKRISILITMVFTVGALATPATAGLTPQKVVGGPGAQYWPSSNGTFVAWSDGTKRLARIFVMQLSNGHRARVNRPGTDSNLGSFIQGTDELIYQEYSGTRSDLFFYDASTEVRRKAPKTVNAPGFEYWPQGSQRFLLYLRATNRFRTRSLFLYDRASGKQRRLVDSIGRGRTIYPGFVGDRYAAWSTCNGEYCTISVYDDVTHVVERLPRPSGKADYAPTIDEGTDHLYFVRSRADVCGRGVTIRTEPLGSTASTVVATLPRGIDTGWNTSLTTDVDSGFLDIYFERWDCRRKVSDIYALRSVNAP